MHNRRKNLYKGRKFESIMLLIVLAFCSYAVSELAVFKSFGISALIIAVSLGAMIGNFAHQNTTLLKKTGVLNIATKQILRLGIILYGFRITFHDIEKVGLNGISVALIIVFSTFFIGLLLGKLFKLDLKESMLISSGSSICGAAAVMASESIVKGGPDRVGVAICTVVVFGTLGMFLFPIAWNLGWFNFFDINQMGYFMGATLHEVAHAVAAGEAIKAGDGAVIEKMIRVLMLVPFLIFLAIFSLKFLNKNGEKVTIKDNIPYFALWFLIASGVSSLNILNTEFALTYVKPSIAFIDTLLLSIAMVALGVNIHRSVILKAGLKPFAMALILFVWLIASGIILVKVLM
ncbi:putative sulfate exporter family transporter [Campylobacter volucris]|uniref:Sulfate exporter family transporter n=1 Tax=Campylobacter volucris TaxID=1031542 RepID=A0AAE6CZ93_9BACT|nr:putative sulfate exporter family transporter [Campylobacter volucris]AJC93606.1 putative membrane protein, YeiH/YadS family [Campylobacter volucris LMG 24379]KAB0577756.1 putative sulfate exporter family transporter [Campylobacter volucris]QBL14004.1 putative sulfate exporter family transporter [Campylobacter volucris]QEL07819.1 YeiH/YadS family membrane protein [Campylobacter volucris]TXK70833.1 putative sulfate exporter family transporter [Campylobacter volucris]